MIKSSRNLISLLLSIFMLSYFQLNSISGFDAIKDKIFTKSMRTELINWIYESLRKGYATTIYDKILNKYGRKSMKIENLHIMSKPTLEERCDTFIRIMEYKTGIKFDRAVLEGGNVDIKPLDMKYGNVSLSTLVLSINNGEKVFSKDF